MRRLFIACAVTLALGAGAIGPRAAAAAGQPVLRAETAPACRFVPPPGTEAGTRTWLGGCRAGAADGPGVLRTRPPGRPPVLYFGAMAAGRPGPGVIERGGDFYPQAGDDREANVQAFRAAAAGARAAARRFAAQGAAASARYYEAEAQRLERTLD